MGRCRELENFPMLALQPCVLPRSRSNPNIQHLSGFGVGGRKASLFRLSWLILQPWFVVILRSTAACLLCVRKWEATSSETSAMPFCVFIWDRLWPLAWQSQASQLHWPRSYRTVNSRTSQTTVLISATISACCSLVIMKRLESYSFLLYETLKCMSFFGPYYRHYFNFTLEKIEIYRGKVNCSGSNS